MERGQGEGESISKGMGERMMRERRKDEGESKNEKEGRSG